ncbi:MAG: hypothetical protein QF805_09525 [Pirellulaceae bacterium]|jgi:hypothetical protein|nr:hypothetical protein [Pirellulaceae bacterium]
MHIRPLTVFVIAAAAAAGADAQVTGNVQDAPPVQQLQHEKLVPKCPPASQMRGLLRPLGQISLDVRPSMGVEPLDCFSQSFAAAPRRPGPRTDHLVDFHWEASGLHHRPLYFEDPQLERHGHGYAKIVQPAISSAKFARDALIFPYRLGLDPPHVSIHELGHERPGNHAIHRREHLPFSLRGAVLQGGATAGFLFLF